MFLIAFASAAGVSVVHALDFRSFRHTPRGSSVDLALLPDFVAKNQCLHDRAPRRICIPALSNFLSSGLEDDNLMCPVRALAVYLTRTEGTECVSLSHLTRVISK